MALQETIPQLVKAEVIIYIEKDKYPADTVYSSEIEEPYSVILYLQGDNIYKSEFVEICYTAKEILKEKQFTVDELFFDYGQTNQKRDGIGYSLELSNDQLGFCKEEIMLLDNLMIYGEDDLIKKYDR